MEPLCLLWSFAVGDIGAENNEDDNVDSFSIVDDYSYNLL